MLYEQGEPVWLTPIPVGLSTAHMDIQDVKAGIKTIFTHLILPKIREKTELLLGEFNHLLPTAFLDKDTADRLSFQHSFKLFENWDYLRSFKMQEAGTTPDAINRCIFAWNMSQICLDKSAVGRNFSGEREHFFREIYANHRKVSLSKSSAIASPSTTSIQDDTLRLHNLTKSLKLLFRLSILRICSIFCSNLVIRLNRQLQVVLQDLFLSPMS